MKPLKKVTALFLLVGITHFISLQAQELSVVSPEEIGFDGERLQRLDKVFEDYVTNNKMGGSTILIARKDKVGYYKSFGYQDIASKTKMKNDAMYRIASQTKAIISVGIMMLQEEGKLLIQDAVGDYIPEFKETSVAVANDKGGYTVEKAKRPITIRDLLTHTAGIGYGYGTGADAWEKAGIQGWYFADRDEPISATIKRMGALPMEAQPGERFVYGYSIDILGVIIEKASGMPLDVFLKENIFTPLHMDDTYFYVPKNKANRLATVYNPKENQTTLQPAPVEGTMDGQGHYLKGPKKSFSGGAGLVSTAKDYYLFLQMMENKGILNGARLLSPSTVRLMTSNHLASNIWFTPGRGFGLGFEIVIDEGLSGVPGSEGQFGWGGAYGSTYWVDPKEELIVVYFTQLRPGSIVKDQQKLRTLIYQALVD